MSGEQPASIDQSWSESEVRAALGLAPPTGRPAFTFSGVSTDSRAIRSGALFVALQGERFDGHDYLEAVVGAGASGAIVRRGTRPVPGLTQRREMIAQVEPLTASFP